MNTLIERCAVIALFSATAIGGFALGAPAVIFFIILLPFLLMLFENL
jgi:hypothetical protein